MWKAVVFFWPFVKEMLLGDKTFGQALKTNKFKTLFAVLIMLSFAMNILAVPRLFVITNEYLALSKKYQELVKSLEPGVHKAPNAGIIVDDRETGVDNGVILTPASATVSSKPPNKPPARPNPRPPITHDDRVEILKKRFDKIKKEEEQF